MNETYERLTLPVARAISRIYQKYSKRHLCYPNERDAYYAYCNGGRDCTKLRWLDNHCMRRYGYSPVVIDYWAAFDSSIPYENRFEAAWFNANNRKWVHPSERQPGDHHGEYFSAIWRQQRKRNPVDPRFIRVRRKKVTA